MVAKCETTKESFCIAHIRKNVCKEWSFDVSVTIGRLMSIFENFSASLKTFHYTFVYARM